MDGIVFQSNLWDAVRVASQHPRMLFSQPISLISFLISITTCREETHLCCRTEWRWMRTNAVNIIYHPAQLNIDEKYYITRLLTVYPVL